MALWTGPLWASMIVCGRSWRGPPTVLWWLGLTSHRYLPPPEDEYSDRCWFKCRAAVLCSTNSSSRRNLSDCYCFLTGTFMPYRYRLFGSFLYRWTYSFKYYRVPNPVFLRLFTPHTTSGNRLSKYIITNIKIQPWRPTLFSYRQGEDLFLLRRLFIVDCCHSHTAFTVRQWLTAIRVKLITNHGL